MQVVIRPALSQLLLVANPVISHQEVSWSPIWFLNHCTQAMCSVSLPRLPPIFSNVTDGLFREPVRNSACRRVLLVAPVARAKRYGDGRTAANECRDRCVQCLRFSLLCFRRLFSNYFCCPVVGKEVRRGVMGNVGTWRWTMANVASTTAHVKESNGLSAETTGGDAAPTSIPANVKLARDGGLSSALSSVTNAVAVTASTDSTVVPRTAA